MRIAILSNVNLDLLTQRQAKTNEVFQTEGYGQWIHYALEDSNLGNYDPDCIFLILDGNALLEECCSAEEGCRELDRTITYIRTLSDRFARSFLAVSTIDLIQRRIQAANATVLETAWCSYWNEQLDHLVNASGNIRRFDLSQFISDFGRTNFYSEKMWYMGSIPYSMKGIQELSARIDEHLRQLSMTRKKVLVLDLDNTLWGGVLGEEGPHGIALGTSLLGAVYRDTQKRIKELKNLGVLLAIVSKNNLSEVEVLFRQNSQMVLKQDDFVSVFANWDDKAVNIQRLALQLNLGLDSFVFLDDNEMEREAVKRTLPMVDVVDFPQDPAELPALILKIHKKYFWQWTITGEDQIKTRQYQEEALRKNDILSASSIEDYLQSLNMKVTIGAAREEQMDRIVQLIGKTNQFNTCSLRFDLPELRTYLDAENRIYTVHVSDKYGDSGLISVIMVSRGDRSATIDNFLMSCRVMGRQIENSILEALENQLYEEGIETLHATYIPTDRNKPVEELWDRLGFEKSACDEQGAIQYKKALDSIKDTALIKAVWNL